MLINVLFETRYANMENQDNIMGTIHTNYGQPKRRYGLTGNILTNYGFNGPSNNIMD